MAAGLRRGNWRLPAAAGLALFLGGCAGPFSTLQPAGPVAGSLAELWWGMLIGSAVLFALVMGLFALVILRPEWGRRVTPMQWIVWGGLVLPGVVLPQLVAYSLLTGERVLPLPGGTVPRIEAEARQFNWTFRYPDHGGAETVDELHLPAGQPVDIMISSVDVIHSFWVPRLAGKLDAIPGHVNVQRLQADTPGRLAGICGEFCGVGHAHMRFGVIVHAPQDFEAALQEAGR